MKDLLFLLGNMILIIVLILIVIIIFKVFKGRVSWGIPPPNLRW